jgi:hypothetical protein
VSKRFFFLLLMVICIMAGGCSSPLPPAPAGTTPLPPETTIVPSGPPTKVVSIDIGWPSAKNWDADADIDGIEVVLTPEDAGKEVIQTAGIVSAKLWSKKEYLSGEPEGDPVQQWQNIQLAVKNYNYKFGATIRLEYNGFKPYLYQMGTVELTLQTPDGGVFTTRAYSVKLN